MPTEVFIDPNVRVRGGQTYSAFRHVRGDIPKVGDEVYVREPESNLVGKAAVTDIDKRDHLIYLRVDWATLAPEKTLKPKQLEALVAAAASAPRPVTTGASGIWHSEAFPRRA